MAQVLREIPSETLIVLDDEECEILYEILWSHTTPDVLGDLREKLQLVRKRMDIPNPRLTENYHAIAFLKKT